VVTTRPEPHIVRYFDGKLAPFVIAADDPRHRADILVGLAWFRGRTVLSGHDSIDAPPSALSKGAAISISNQCNLSSRHVLCRPAAALPDHCLKSRTWQRRLLHVTNGMQPA
jgi:hypothetical protein